MNKAQSIALEMLYQLQKIKTKARKCQQEDMEVIDKLEEGSIACPSLQGRVVGRQEILNELNQFVDKYVRLLESMANEGDCSDYKA